MAAAAAKKSVLDETLQVTATKNIKTDVANVKLKISEKIVQKGYSFLISHGKKPQEAWEDKYGPEGDDADAPFEKLFILYKTKAMDGAKAMQEALVTHYDKFFAKKTPAIKKCWLNTSASKTPFVPGLPPFYVWAAVKKAPEDAKPAPKATPADAKPAPKATAAESK